MNLLFALGLGTSIKRDKHGGVSFGRLRKILLDKSKKKKRMNIILAHIAFFSGYSRPKPSALDIAMMSFCCRIPRVSYWGRTNWLKQVWASGRLSGRFVILVTLNVISPIPPTGTRSLPVVNNKNFFLSSSDNDWRTSQNSLKEKN